MEADHRELVRRAAAWLRGTMRCGVVLCEASGDHEQPDAIGWKHGGRYSVLVEVKTSRADFLRDARKWHRRADAQGVRLSLGDERWYVTPPGLLRPDELPDGWGLAEAEPKRMRKVRAALKPAHLRPERQLRGLPLLYSAMRKVELGIAPDTYGSWHIPEAEADGRRAVRAWLRKRRWAGGRDGRWEPACPAFEARAGAESCARYRRAENDHGTEAQGDG